MIARFLTTCLMACVAIPVAAQPQGNPSELPTTGCRIRVTPSPASWIIAGYDPFANEEAQGTYSVTYVNDGDGVCAFTPSFELREPPLGLSDGLEAPLKYAIVDLTEARDVTPRSGRTFARNASATISLDPSESRTILYRFVPDTRGVKRDGTFSQEVTIEAVDRRFNTIGGAPLALGLTVLPSARIGLSGAYTVSGGQATVDLGPLREGVAPVPLQLRLSSTGPYEIDIVSANNGRLRLGSSEWSIHYSVAIDGQVTNLGAPASIANRPESGLRRDSLPMRFVIGKIDDVRAGSYTDTLSISVRAR